MGLLSWWSGGPKVTSKDRAILDLKVQRDKIKQFQKRLTFVQDRERALAKQCLRDGDRKRALLFLRKEQYQKQLILKTDEQLNVLEELVSSIEFAQVQRDVAFGLEHGAKVLKEINAEMSLDKIDKIMDDSAEGVMYQQEVEELLNSRITRSDELEVERELEALEAETDLKLPSAPRNTHISKQKQEEKQKQQEKEQEEEEEREMVPA